MKRKLPPLNALRAFEAAGRHRSFTLAAEELNVTQAAISHQVRALEEYFQQDLFLRQNRNLALTSAAQNYLPTVAQALNLINDASRQLVRHDNDTTLRVSTLPSFAAKWLLPRLASFQALHPEIDILVSSRNELADLEREDIDVGLRFGVGKYPGLHSEKILHERKFPVCSPSLLSGDKPLSRPEDLKHHTLLHDEVFGGDIEIDWQGWLEVAGFPELATRRGPWFNDSSMLLTASIAGQGVALARASLAVDDMAKGLLIKPFGPEIPTTYNYYFVTRPNLVDREPVRTFFNWIQAETQKTGAAITAA
ncbi:transcriptional regulator GcvA [Fodinicurvata fenggangensis]|uniref:transcriptional regulator GcvA n=1 Tax=Fodinicurvata fenggangensis TaxID=1121830 RepID=UPI00047889A5|nr:transcriptional regulator GcvA [Fodinicurvata fenggangensis]